MKKINIKIKLQIIKIKQTILKLNHKKNILYETTIDSNN